MTNATATKTAPVLTARWCPYPGCGRERVIINGEQKRHCDGHEIQVNAVGATG